MFEQYRGFLAFELIAAPSANAIFSVRNQGAAPHGAPASHPYNRRMEPLEQMGRCRLSRSNAFASSES